MKGFTAFAMRGDNSTAHDLALGCLLAWLPVFITSTIVDRNFTRPDRTRARLNRLVDRVRVTLRDQKFCRHCRSLSESSTCEAENCGSQPQQRAVLRYLDQYGREPGAQNMLGNDQLASNLARLAKEFERKEIFVSLWSLTAPLVATHRHQTFLITDLRSDSQVKEG